MKAYKIIENKLSPSEIKHIETCIKNKKKRKSKRKSK